MITDLKVDTRIIYYRYLTKLSQKWAFALKNKIKSYDNI